MKDDPPKTSEPTPIPCIYLSGADIEPDPYTVRVCGWIQIDGGATMVLRFAMALGPARRFHAALGRRVKSGAHH